MFADALELVIVPFLSNTKFLDADDSVVWLWVDLRSI
jgi:hypothetical protein